MAKGKSKAGGGGGAIKYDKKNSFWGNYRQESGQYIEPETQVLDNDHIIIATNNVRTVKGNPVLVINDNQAVYLKDWQVQGVGEKVNGSYVGDTLMVKLTRQYFKPYTFHSDFNGFSFNEADTFDSLLHIARSQKGNAYSPFKITISPGGIRKVKTGAKLG